MEHPNEDEIHVMQNKNKCLAFYQQNVVPLTPGESHVLDQIDAKYGSSNQRKGLPYGHHPAPVRRVPGPLRRSAVSFLAP